jgi:multidrug efflux pump subunit AcrA (membrane-fusion protein)
LVALSAMLIVSGCDDDSDDTAQGTETEPRLVRAIKIGATELLGKRSRTGRARAAQETALAFRVSGRIVKREVDVGDVVSEGDVIARLDTSTYSADVARLEADLAAAKADADAKDQQLERVMKLVESGTYSQARGDQARGARDLGRESICGPDADGLAPANVGDQPEFQPVAGKLGRHHPRGCRAHDAADL